MRTCCPSPRPLKMILGVGVRGTESATQIGIQVKSRRPIFFFLHNWGLLLFPPPTPHWSMASGSFLLASSDWLVRSCALLSFVSMCQANLPVVKWGLSRCACMRYYGLPVRIHCLIRLQELTHAVMEAKQSHSVCKPGTIGVRWL